MHKLNLFLNDAQYEKLQLITESSTSEELEESVNEMVYHAIDTAWLRYKGKAIEDMLETGNYDTETARFDLDGHDCEVWCDGEQAVITEDDKTCTVQLIDGKLHYVLTSGTRVKCEEDTAERLTAILEKAGAKLKDYTEEELNEELVISLDK